MTETQPWLTGWKEIGAYIGIKCPKALKSYEARFGMPVHRLPSNQPVIILAELEIWLIEFDKRRRLLVEKKKKQAKK